MKLYYCNIENFGDKLNEQIFSKLFKINVVHTDVFNADAIGIGSILDKLLLRHFESFKINKNNCLNIYSSGFGFCKSYYLSKIKYVKPLSLRRKVNPIALRGVLSQNILQNILNVPLNCVLIDAGILAGLLVDYTKIDKIYDLGIVPHYSEKDNPIFQKLKNKIKNSIILDLKENPIDFVLHLAQCKAIASTALHPLIASDSMGIPNLWIRVSEKTTSYFKFIDYYSAYGIFNKPVYLNNNNLSGINNTNIIQSYKITLRKVHELQNDLIKVFEANK